MERTVLHTNSYRQFGLEVAQLEDYGLGAQSPLSSSSGPLSERVVKSPAGEKFVLVSHRCTRHLTPLYPPSHAVVPAISRRFPRISRRFPRISRRFPRISRRSPRHHHDITTYTRFEEWS